MDRGASVDHGVLLVLHHRPPHRDPRPRGGDHSCAQWHHGPARELSHRGQLWHGENCWNFSPEFMIKILSTNGIWFVWRLGFYCFSSDWAGGNIMKTVMESRINPFLDQVTRNNYIVSLTTVFRSVDKSCQEFAVCRWWKRSRLVMLKYSVHSFCVFICSCWTSYKWQCFGMYTWCKIYLYVYFWDSLATKNPKAFVS